ncbi:hypothetical protein DOTSEDRAFT_33501 [Dothistroma septosporum NZE10]|uniref:Mitochondrial chaperone BCS1-like ATPase lid domain-containing protein n=1 Tax=Dothistroma septosporum (strain NZE10 / CBS 128990) TaxID=675120 RepID=N1PN67_DOTSN|nr:hypothetical protein DOTSEDRAFT_33501 [Dothistroma septosporum NZE10]
MVSLELHSLVVHGLRLESSLSTMSAWHGTIENTFSTGPLSVGTMPPRIVYRANSPTPMLTCPTVSLHFDKFDEVDSKSVNANTVGYTILRPTLSSSMPESAKDNMSRLANIQRSLVNIANSMRAGSGTELLDLCPEAIFRNTFALIRDRYPRFATVLESSLLSGCLPSRSALVGGLFASRKDHPGQLQIDAKHDVPSLAEKFAANVLEDRITSAEIQNYLLPYRESPDNAVNMATSWADELIKTKAEGRNVSRFTDQIGHVETVPSKDSQVIALAIPPATPANFAENHSELEDEDIDSDNGSEDESDEETESEKEDEFGDDRVVKIKTLEAQIEAMKDGDTRKAKPFSRVDPYATMLAARKRPKAKDFEGKDVKTETQVGKVFHRSNALQSTWLQDHQYRDVYALHVSEVVEELSSLPASSELSGARHIKALTSKSGNS